MGLLPVESITLAYTLFVALVTIVFAFMLPHPVNMLLQLLGVFFITICLCDLNKRYPSRYTFLLRILFPIAMLGYWYPQTYDFNRFLPNLDHIFAAADQNIFGYQPAIAFGQALPQQFWSEAFCLGYFSYYLMIIGVPLFYFFRRYNQLEHASYILVGSFYLYYIIFIFLPVAGPQCYYQPAGMENITAGIFPNLHDYFRTHAEIVPTLQMPDGFFHSLVNLAHQGGERPTAAFPSSHIGAGTILLMLAWRAKHSLFWLLFPFYILLCCATVYIQAHYFVDAVAGLVTGILFFFLFDRISFFKQKQNGTGTSPLKTL
jgi:membrane-associated phospholipid phosphatase